MAALTFGDHCVFTINCGFRVVRATPESQRAAKDSRGSFDGAPLTLAREHDQVGTNAAAAATIGNVAVLLSGITDIEPHPIPLLPRTLDLCSLLEVFLRQAHPIFMANLAAAGNDNVLRGGIEALIEPMRVDGLRCGVWFSFVLSLDL